MFAAYFLGHRVHVTLH